MLFNNIDQATAEHTYRSQRLRRQRMSVRNTSARHVRNRKNNVHRGPGPNLELTLEQVIADLGRPATGWLT